MTELVVLAYADEHRGAEVLANMQRLRTAGFLDVEDAICVVRQTDWTVMLYRAVDVSVSDDCCGRFWRGLVSSLILAPGSAMLREDVASYGIEPDVERRIAAALPPGSSAVCMIVPRRALQCNGPTLQCFGGTLLATSIGRTCQHTAA